MPNMMSIMIYALSFLFVFAHAVPRPVQRDVVDPHITSPDATSVWHVGDQKIITWDTSSLPPSANITNPKGQVLLGFLTSDSENLMIDSPLAKGFALTDGQVSIVVPDVPTRTNYIIALLGDSGNISPTFQIIGASSPSVSASSSPNPSPTSNNAGTNPSHTASLVPPTVSAPGGPTATPSSVASAPSVTPSATGVSTGVASAASSVSGASLLSSSRLSSASSLSASSTTTALASTRTSGGALSWRDAKISPFGFAAIAIFALL